MFPIPRIGSGSFGFGADLVYGRDRHREPALRLSSHQRLDAGLTLESRSHVSLQFTLDRDTVDNVTACNGHQLAV
jgi:hypothetical protein